MGWSRLILAGLLMGLCLEEAVAAADPEDMSVPLSLRATLMSLRDPGRSSKPGNFDPSDTIRLREADPRMMDVKHQLRDWVEARLAAAGRDADPAALARQLNADLQAADLFCEAQAGGPDRCPDDGGFWSGVGFLAPVRLEPVADGALLVLRTGIGIRCGTDDSAYAYQWRDGARRRLWQSEQDIQLGKPYLPQTLQSVQISAPDPATRARLMLTLGHQSWCSSNWYPVYIRLWQVADSGVTSLVDEAPDAYLARHDIPILGRLTSTEATVEFSAGGFDEATLFHGAVRHYRIDGGTVTRIGPAALTPRDFAQEWVKIAWPEALRWAAPNVNVANLQAWRKKWGKDGALGEVAATRHCRADPELWQVEANFADTAPDLGQTYFLVRWRKPDRLQMVDILSAPRADCDEADEAADRERSLFTPREWGTRSSVLDKKPRPVSQAGLPCSGKAYCLPAMAPRRRRRAFSLMKPSASFWL
ncbi:hypothetical protein UCD39_18940 [Nitrospirillum sp. BR 11752]|uniref:hypothetical protein n=1 Tax=Nitrospirillum sp. BR 11752 TaxID=3104293 RepID=UPI002ECEED48|nr:hypothetical protein [Nitrospirillum sp. BR 11752]